MHCLEGPDRPTPTRSSAIGKRQFAPDGVKRAGPVCHCAGPRSRAFVSKPLFAIDHTPMNRANLYLAIWQYPRWGLWLDEPSTLLQIVEDRDASSERCYRFAESSSLASDGLRELLWICRVTAARAGDIIQAAQQHDMYVAFRPTAGAVDLKDADHAPTIARSPTGTSRPGPSRSSSTVTDSASSRMRPCGGRRGGWPADCRAVCQSSH
jgi:hypothetical protein